MSDLPIDNLPKLILGSSSPRRCDLLTAAGYEFEVVPPHLPEPTDLPAHLSPIDYAQQLAHFKARCVAESHGDACVLGADTVVAVNGKIIGKADDEKHATEILTELSHTPHKVITGLALLGPGKKFSLAAETTVVTMKPMTTREIRGYIDSGEWIGKAGAYAIQETADRFVEKINGSFSNVVGLPLELLAQLLKLSRRS